MIDDGSETTKSDYDPSNQSIVVRLFVIEVVCVLSAVTCNVIVTVN